MNVLVTGGAGYIGSVVVDELLRDGHAVVVYDNLYKGHRDAVPAAAQFIRADLLDPIALRRGLREHRIGSVIHMAADSLVGESVIDPGKYYRNNLVASLALLDAMRECGVEVLVFSSTAAVYGEPDKQPIEETDPTRPSNPYGETKLAFEHALAWHRNAYGLRFASLRYFNAAGATERLGERHDPETHLIPLVLQAAAGHMPEVTVFGDDYATKDGTCVRDYIHVVDLSRAHVLAVSALLDAKAGYGEIFNLGCGGSGYSVREVIETARGVTGRPIRVRIGSRRPGDPAVLVASSAKIASQLGWKPKLQDLGAIVESAWRWMQSHATR